MIYERLRPGNLYGRFELRKMIAGEIETSKVRNNSYLYRDVGTGEGTGCLENRNRILNH